MSHAERTDEAGTAPAAQAYSRPTVYYRASIANVIRYESLSQRDTETHARLIYGIEGVICDIEEVAIQTPAC